MRAALISLTGQPRDEAGTAPLAVAGKTLARRQLDFALAAGCERVIAVGDGGSREAIALRHAAEDAGAAFQVAGDSRGLLGAVRGPDELLVLAPGLLPQAGEALEALKPGGAVLVLPVGAAVQAGFERIDLDRAWAGAGVLPGSLISRLAELPADVEPASSLMRAAMQARVPEHRLPETLLADGCWSMLAEGAKTVADEIAWLRRHSPLLRAVPGPLSHLVLGLAGRLLAARWSATPLTTFAGILLVGAIAAASFGTAALGFALILPGVLVARCAVEIVRLREAPFGRVPRRLSAVLSGLVDATMVACACFAIEGSWLHRLFPILVLLAALHMPGAWGRAPLVRNRALLVALFAIAAAFEMAEPAIMAAALAILAAKAAQLGANRG